MKKYLKRIFKKFKIRFSTMGRSSLRTNSPEDIEPYEKTAFKICVKVISHPESEFMIAPMSNKRYIINQELSLFVIIDYGRVEITNHIFHYDVKLSRRDFERITYLYDTETEKRRTATEDEVKGNIKNSLVKVYEKISAK
jgi:hypothetical protein